MKICDQCRSLILDDNAACPRCAEQMRLTVEALAPRSRPPVLPKVLKWLFIGVTVAVLVAAAAITWILNSLGPMPSFG
ncbi:hypothetical protein [Pseudomonas corrugata]|uniref:Uncharacterized protein n=2 Tax=Pseudomonas corrugata TaxID=47879 RepID=A0A8B6UK85_9PSED|nr:hypothetical protein [Pseudomonas corrugata]MDU9032908.1 hypothetical protein [Pseudomonas corrugata]MDU9038024.1 hypothetical protein [Pseudomonas corrugata]QTH12312.1 hypothetical protein C4C32_17110 [Pseudomonas corrugata]UZE04302.1 hypothetical protein LOY65_16485 [Pseudomonas corrugata]